MIVIRHGIQFTSKTDGVTTSVQDYPTVQVRDAELAYYRKAGRTDAVAVDYQTNAPDPAPPRATPNYSYTGQRSPSCDNSGLGLAVGLTTGFLFGGLFG